MSEYILTSTDIVIRQSDHAFIPSDPANCDRIEYDAWLAAGGVPDPYVRPQEEINWEQRKQAFDADVTRTDLLARLRTASPQQINQYVDANVTNLVEATALLKRILLVLAAV